MEGLRTMEVVPREWTKIEGGENRGKMDRAPRESAYSEVVPISSVLLPLQPTSTCYAFLTNLGLTSEQASLCTGRCPKLLYACPRSVLRPAADLLTSTLGFEGQQGRRQLATLVLRCPHVLLLSVHAHLGPTLSCLASLWQPTCSPRNSRLDSPAGAAAASGGTLAVMGTSKFHRSSSGGGGGGSTGGRSSSSSSSSNTSTSTRSSSSSSTREGPAVSTSSPHLLQVIFRKYPQILLRSFRTIEDKLCLLLACFQRIGINPDQAGRVLAAFPRILSYSLERKIWPAFRFLLDDVSIDISNLGRLIRRCPRVLGHSLEGRLRRTAAFLREDLGLNQQELARLAVRQPHVLCHDADAVLRKRVRFLRPLLPGLSPQQGIAVMVKRCPTVLTRNVEGDLRPKAEYLIGEMRRSWRDFLEYPQVFELSLRRRIMRAHRRAVKIGVATEHLPLQQVLSG